MSRSHNSGRDVDLAYYMANKNGESVASRYHRFDASGLSKANPKAYKLDVPRNWALVKGLLENTKAEVQWIIVAPWIEKLLLDYAHATGEPWETIFRAERLMMLPGWAKSHDNHIHVRVLCSPIDWATGCRNGGPVWPWNHQMQETLNAAKQTVLSKLKSASPAVRYSALKTVAKKRIDTAAREVSALLKDKKKYLRRLALHTLFTLTNEASASTILKIARQCTPKVAYKLLKKALNPAGPEGLPAARDLLDGKHPILKAAIKRSTRAHLIKMAKRHLARFSRPRTHLPGGATNEAP